MPGNGLRTPTLQCKAIPPLLIVSILRCGWEALLKPGDIDGPLRFLRNSPVLGTLTSDHVPCGSSYRQTSMPYRPSMSVVSANANSSTMEEFRSVIDDLTVANKKLKEELKKYERLYDDHLQNEKLFEIHFHGLSDHKQRELEEILRKFAADIERDPNADYSVVSSHSPPCDPQRGISSRASRFAESGYASMSACGQNSTITPSSQATDHDRDCRRTIKVRHNQHQTIQSYLDGIPVSLLAKNRIAPIKESKKQLVVRRLEQIFAGKQSAPGGQPQPMQQEKISQLAAMDDRRMREATGQCSKPEGNREARMMPARTDEVSITVQNVLLKRCHPIVHLYEHGLEGFESPNQRPTRPLDLDLHQAEVPARNMEYIRHLGFSPPDMVPGGSPRGDHGWLYLNLLYNMAQLHTLNVTLDFLKDAITEHCSAFELSHDEQKVRWKGNRNVTTNSGNSSSENQGMHHPYEIFGNSKSSPKHLEIRPNRNAEMEIGPRRKLKPNKRTKYEQNQNKYTHVSDSDEKEDFHGFSMVSSRDWPNHVMQAGDFSQFGRQALRSSAKRCRNSPMIFYNSKAKFCTDLTGDRHGCSNPIPESYTSVTSSLLGVSIPQPLTHSPTSGTQELRGLFGSSRMGIDSTKTWSDCSSDEDIDFSLDTLKDDIDTEPLGAVEFEASGLAGIRLEDHFSIHVRRSRLQISAFYTRRTRGKPRLYSQRILDALNGGLSVEGETSSMQQKWVSKEKVLFASYKSLPSSTLPPASFLFDSASSRDVDSDLESDMSSGLPTSSSSGESPATVLRLLKT